MIAVKGTAIKIPRNPNKEPPGDGTKRVEIPCNEYTQVVFFDHITRRKH